VINEIFSSYASMNSIIYVGIRGVGVVSGPPVLRGGAINDELIHVTDWMPTLLHLAGGNVSNLDTDGMNQWNSISLGMPSPRKVCRCTMNYVCIVYYTCTIYCICPVYYTHTIYCICPVYYTCTVFYTYTVYYTCAIYCTCIVCCNILCLLALSH